MPLQPEAGSLDKDFERKHMKMNSTVVALLGAAMLYGPGRAAADDTTGLSAEQALRNLKDGNKRYVESIMDHPRQTAQRRTGIAKSQHPFAMILSCSDSRVPPEVIFDQGLGDLFVVRTAGNIADDIALGSLEYGAEHLGVKLIVVLGHERCGAVDATVKGGAAPGHIATLVEAIRPAVEQSKANPGDPVHNAVRANVKRVVSQLESSEPVLSERVRQGTLRIVAARYDLDSGAVEILR